MLHISKSTPGLMRRPARLMRFSMTSGRPIRIGTARPSSTTVCTARSTVSSSPSAYTTPARRGLGALEHRLHQQSGAEHEAGQALVVGGKVGDRPRRHARVHRRLGHRRRQLHQQARIERLRDQVVGAEARRLAAVGARADVGRLAPRQRGDRLDAGELHRLVDHRGADIQRAAEDVREAQRVVDLVRIVRTAGGDDAVRAHRLGVFRGDLRVRIGQREDDRPRGHRRDHLRLQDAAGGQAEEHVGAVDDFGERARCGVARVARLVRVQVAAAGVQHAVAIQRQDVLRLHAQRDQHVQAGDAGRAGAGGRQLHVLDASCRRPPAR